jgi:hypothetical protein
MISTYLGDQTDDIEANRTTFLEFPNLRIVFDDITYNLANPNPLSP